MFAKGFPVTPTALKVEDLRRNSFTLLLYSAREATVVPISSSKQLVVVSHVQGAS